MKYILDREGVRIPSTRLGSATAEKSQKLLIGMSGRGGLQVNTFVQVQDRHDWKLCLRVITRRAAICILLPWTPYLLPNICIRCQWQIQDFPDGGATPEFGAKTYYLAIFLPKTPWKWKKLGSSMPAVVIHKYRIYYNIYLIINGYISMNFGENMFSISSHVLHVYILSKTTVAKVPAHRSRSIQCTDYIATQISCYLW